MIKNFIPGFNFINPDFRVLDIRVRSYMESVRVIGEPRRIRTIWTPELAQDVAAFHNIDAEAELTALLSEQITAEIDQQIIRDINDNQRFYDGNNAREIVRRWTEFTTPRTTWFNLMPNFVPPINYDTEIRHDWVGTLFTPEPNYTILPNEEGWFMDGVFDSLLIKMEIKPYKFLKRKSRRNRGIDFRGLVGL
jgi:hypothetical protein